MLQMNTLKPLLALGLALLVSACGVTDPGSSEGKTALEETLGKELRGARFELARFDKTNGQAAEVNGVPNYTLFFTAKVTYPDGYRTECLQDFNGLDGFRTGMQCSTDFMFNQTPFRPANPGDAVEVSGTIRFAKTENGWLAGQTVFEPPAKQGE